MNDRLILTVNAGSSSIKFSAYCAGAAGGLTAIGKANLASFEGGVEATCKINGADQSPQMAKAMATSDGTYEGDVTAAIDFLKSAVPTLPLMAVGHRIVHGGQKFAGPVQATADILAELADLSPLAPSHQPHNLKAVEILGAAAPDVPQVLCFDTAFHRTQPRVAELYPLPKALSDSGIIRFGFHGLSYAHIGATLGDIFPGRPHQKIVVAHLGSGASLCALKEGKSVATTMGLTALDGIPMATRSGAVDPGILLHLMQDKGMSADEVADILYKQSGLLGLSGISGDVRELLASEAPAAAEALSVYAYRIAREIGSLTVALGGLDGLVFTGGVGENAAPVRQAICDHLAWLGIALDDKANAANAPHISQSSAAIPVAVVPADEEQVIAREALGLCRG